MIIGGTSFNIAQWPEPTTRPAITWKRGADGYHVGRDRGASEDVYEGRVRVFGIPATLDSLQAVLDANREGITLSGFNTGEMIFGANVSYAGSISATVTDFGMRRNLQSTTVFELEIGFRAISPTLLGTTPSLASLRLQEGWEGNRSTDITKHFSYSQDASYLQHGTDAGIFTGRFLQTTDQMKAIRAFLLSEARAAPFQFPNVMADFYPFGANESERTFQMVCAVAWSDRRVNLNRWELSLTLAQALPYFPGGSGDSDPDPEFYLAGGTSGAPDFHIVPPEEI